MTEDGYDQESWAAYEAALEKAKALLDDENALQTDVDAAVTELTTARTDLKADITELQMLYDSYAAEYIPDKESEYLPDAWMTMQQALTEAKALLDQETAGTDKATPAEVKEATNALNEAKEALDEAKRADTAFFQTQKKSRAFRKARRTSPRARPKAFSLEPRSLYHSRRGLGIVSAYSVHSVAQNAKHGRKRRRFCTRTAFLRPSASV